MLRSNMEHKLHTYAAHRLTIIDDRVDQLGKDYDRLPLKLQGQDAETGTYLNDLLA